MQPFYLSKGKQGYYRVYFVNQITGTVLTAKSTHSKNKVEAAVIASDWLKNGIPGGYTNTRKMDSGLNISKIASLLSRDEAAELIKILNTKFSFDSELPKGNEIECSKAIEPVPVSNTTADSSSSSAPSPTSVTYPTPVTVSNSSAASKPILLLDALFNFWDFNNSEYVKKRQLRGFEIKERNCKEKLGIVRRYWAKYFDADRTIQSLTSKELDDFLLSLRRDYGLAADTVNKTMTAGNMAFEFLIKEGLLEKNPLAGVERFKVSPKKRGIPTETEMRQLMTLDWDWTDSAYKLAFKVAALFGLRAGEISGLQVCDVDVVGDLLYIRHSWNDVDKLKSTKNGDDRTIPIEHGVAVELLNNARRNPEYSDTSFVFWSAKVAGQPIWPSSFEDDFYIAMQKIGISEEQRKERNIVFHSLRHYCATQIAQRTSLEIAMKILGHRTEEMTRLYSEHETQVKLNNAKEVLSQGWKILTA